MVETNNILIKIDQNNLIYIDPNTVLSNGQIKSRQVEPENLVMYVNLEADLIPRTTFISSNHNENTLFSVADGMLSMIQNKDGKDFDTKWTDSFLEYSKKTDLDSSLTNEFYQNDKTAQTFGINDISIEVKGTNFIPRVVINFIDVRGKTLFESPENSPYKAFFHLPWPIFYLTVKGYYGKPIRYRLHMISFKSKLNSSNGNFEIETVFVGSTYAYLTDIPLNGILNAPYMYGIDITEDKKTNEKTETIVKKLKKTSHGYVTLKSVFQEYIQKGLLPSDMPVKTLREVAVIAENLDKILENVLFDEIIDYNVLAGIKEFSKDISNFVTYLKSWKKNYLSNQILYSDGDEVYLKLARNDTSLTIIKNEKDEGSLESLIKNQIQRLEKNQAFGSQAIKDRNKGKKIKTKTISFQQLDKIDDFYKLYNGKYGVDINEILSRLREIEEYFVEQANEIANVIQKEMNSIIKSPEDGVGFEPTIRNVIGIILANADTYIRLMKEVHLNAFNIGEQRKNIISTLSDESIGESIYPWPEIKKEVEGEKSNVLAYPASLDLIKKLKSNDRRLWPEVEFVEEFQKVQTKKIDTLADGDDSTEMIKYVFETDKDSINIKDISTLTFLSNIIPYHNKIISSILYEIWERAKYITTVDSFNNKTIRELATIDYENFVEQIKDDYDLIDILNQRIKNPKDLEENMIGFSPFERYPYLQDQLPTIPYLIDIINNDYKIEDFIKNKKGGTNLDSYQNLKDNLLNYKSEDYRTKIYPFNSDEYLSYIDKLNFTKNELKLNNILQVDTRDGFIISPIDTAMWVKTGYENNIFNNKININDSYKHLLNTPYFHKQLMNDFFNNKIVGKYSSSAYLLLNSLPFNDLDDEIKYNDKTILMSTMFREVGASHFIPYHLILKWGSIYHRYKKYLIDGVDIIENITEPLNGDMFFDNLSGRTYNFSGATINRVLENNIGLNPFYQSIFYQIINDYTFFNPQNGPLDYLNAIQNEYVENTYKSMDGNRAWTSFVDNSKFNNDDLNYTLLPSNGYTDYDNLRNYLQSEQENYRIIWSDNESIENVINYSGETFPNYSQYFKNIDGYYTISENNRKVLDLIATFKPDILDNFEKIFIDFSTKSFNEEFEYNEYDVKHYKFQSLLKDICVVKKEENDFNNVDELVRDIQIKQKENLENITNDILSNNNLIKMTISNPKEINNYYLGGYIDEGVENFNVNTYDLLKNQHLIELYLGQDIDGYYEEFFLISNIEISEENILNFRFIAQIYAGYRKDGFNADKETFIFYLKQNIIDKELDRYYETQGQRARFKLYLQTFIGNFNFDELIKDNNRRELTIDIGFNEDTIKLEQYNYFKSFNDKWVAGNSLGQKTLLEEFLFLDKANKDIGDEAFIDLKKIADVLNQPKKDKMSLYNVINIIIQNTGFDLRVLPSYVNFYGSSFTNRNKVTSSDTVADNMFGTFLDIDYENSSPKVLLQYVGKASNHLDLSNISDKYLFKDDGVDVSDPDSNPVIISPEAFRNTDFSKSNKVVAFEVSFGDQNQGIFKDLQLDQSSIKNTTESFEVLERLGNSQAGSSTSQIDIGLFDIYRQVSYSCQVTAMGNAMIQPTMYFHLKNVPLFRGSYWITEVSHTITSGNFETTFVGSRIPLRSLPDPKESFMASYRTLFDNLVNKAEIKVNEDSQIKADQENTIQTEDGKTGSFNQLEQPISEETLVEKVGITPYKIPYNQDNIQLIKYQGDEWLKANVIEADSSGYLILPTSKMKILSMFTNYGSSEPILWSDINKESDFYITNFKFGPIEMINIINNYSKTQFLNPKNGKEITINTEFDYNSNIYTGPIDYGVIKPYSIVLSKSLFKKLDLYNQDKIIYFKLIKE